MGKLMTIEINQPPIRSVLPYKTDHDYVALVPRQKYIFTHCVLRGNLRLFRILYTAADTLEL